MPWTVTAKSETEAEILIYSIIGGWNEEWERQTAQNFIKKIKNLGDIQNITLRINSNGGDVFEAQALYSYLKTHKATKTVRIDGLAASAASLIAMVGDRIIMPENALMMIHNPSTIAWGDASEMRSAADMLDKVRDTITAVYRSKTGIDASKLERMMDDETWMTANEALDLGFCDETDEAVEIAACAVGDEKRYFAFKTNAGEAVVSDTLAQKIFSKVPHNIKVIQAPETPTAETTENRGKTTAITKEDDIVDFKTIEELEAKYPALVQAIRDNAKNGAYEDGVKEERARIQALDKLVKPGREALIAKAKYEDPRDARDIALDLLAADKTQETVEARRRDADELDGITAPTETVTDANRRDAAADAVANLINEQRGYKK